MPSSPSFRGARQNTVGSWKNPWFDLSSQYIPSSYKEMFRWCHFLYSTNSVIAPIVNKKSAYVITELIYSSDRDHPKSEDLWKEVLERVMKLREFEFKMNLDSDVFGNAFASIYYPFERYLKCPSCEAISSARKVKWIYSQFKFSGTCPACKSAVNFQAEDRTVHNRSRIRLIRWNPQYISIRYNPFTDGSEYIYNIPKYIRKRLADKKQNHYLVSETPIEILEAVKKKKNILLDPTNIYHMKNPSPSGEDDAFGMPPMLPVFKDVWLMQVYRQAQEAVALDHVLPMTILSPSSTPSGASAHNNTNLSEWARKTLDIVHRWRRDQNSIFTVPYPVVAQNIRGDAGALNVFNEISQIRQQIAGGLDIPADFLYGTLNYSGSSISLRVLENLFLSRTEQLNNFLRDFVLPKVQSFLSLPKVEVKHRDFKMADDAQQKQIALSLRQTNTISDQTTVEELGFDYEQESERKREELKQRNNELIENMRANAEAQGMSMQIQMEYQTRAQQQQPQSQTPQIPQGLRGMGKVGAVQDPSSTAGGKGFSMKADFSPLPPLMDTMVDRYLKGPGNADAKRLELLGLQRSNPLLYNAIKERIGTIRGQANDPYMKALPDQKPPRREDSPV